MIFPKRTHGCGEPRPAHVGETLVFNGWVHRVRDLGGLCFVDLRDRTGIVQLVIDPVAHPGYAELRSECCIAVTGQVRERAAEAKNPRMETGEVEVTVERYTLLSPSKVLPFPLSDETQMGSVNEELRIKHRYLDLRRPAMYRKLAIRAAAIRRIRKHLDDRGFLEIETPIITKSTPEGARDYLVPYRLDPGLFYALPQSPQQYKQLLMVAGCERYYQIARCFRDEAQRSDRQPEFTQLDLEMSFVDRDDVLNLIEGLTLDIVNGLIGEFGLEKDPIEPFTWITYDDAMERYGCDKPDLRFGLELFDVTEIGRGSEFSVFRTTAESGGKVRGVRYPGGAKLSRKEIGELENLCRDFGAKGLATLAVEGQASEGSIALDNGLHMRGSIAKFFKPGELSAIVAAASAEAGDLLCFIGDGYDAGNNVLYRLRNEIGDRCGLRDRRKMKFCFVIDFPLVMWNDDENRWDSVHHPFTSPLPEDIHLLDSDPGAAKANCYDVVCNGVEWASGSIRIHRSDVQSRIFSLLGIDEQNQAERFGHILEAFQYGAPPHGGIAPGIDRLIMFLTDDENIREVIAFPKIGQGLDPLMGAPSPIDDKQWQESGLQLRARDDAPAN